MYSFVIIYTLCFLSTSLLADNTLNLLQTSSKQENNLVEDNNITEEEFFPNIPLAIDEANPLNKIKKRNNTKSITATSENNYINEKQDNKIKNDKLKILTTQQNKSETQKKASPWKILEQDTHSEKSFTLLPSSIYRKKYGEVNKGLPKAIFTSDYKKLTFKEIKKNNIHAVKSLIDHIQEIDFRDSQGNTPLLYAVINDKKQIVRLLLAKGADINAINLEQKNPYNIALENKRYQILKILNDYTT